MSNQPNSLADIAAIEGDRLTAVTVEAINEIDELLTASIEKEVLPEDIFVEYFLDYFRDPVSQANTTLPSKWLEVSGGPYSEVDILDKTGKVIYTVPSLFISATIDPEIMANYNFSDIAANYNMTMKITSTAAQNYLNTALSGLPEAILTDTRRHIAKLSAIFARYDTADATPETATDTTVADKPTAGMFDM